MKKTLKSKKGFTLVELMVVVAILGILVAVAVPVYNNVTGEAEAKTIAANLRTIESAVSQWKMLHPGETPDQTPDADGDLYTEGAADNFLEVWPVGPGAETVYSVTAGVVTVDIAEGVAGTWGGENGVRLVGGQLTPAGTGGDGTNP